MRYYAFLLMSFGGPFVTSLGTVRLNWSRELDPSFRHISSRSIAANCGVLPVGAPDASHALHISSDPIDRVPVQPRNRSLPTPRGKSRLKTASVACEREPTRDKATAKEVPPAGSHDEGR